MPTPFHVKLARLAQEQRTSRSDLARHLGDVSKSTVNNWFAGKGEPGLTIGLRIARMLGVTLDYLADEDATEVGPAGAAPTLTEDERVILLFYHAMGLTRDRAIRGMATMVSPLE